MARIRTIKPEFWTSEQVMELSMPARLAFIGMWIFCDDQGVHPARPKTLKAELFPSDQITADEVACLVDEMIEQGLVREYEVNGVSYWLVNGFRKHQKIEKPTYKHPSPPKESTTENSAIDFENPQPEEDQSSNSRRGVGEDSSSARPRNGMEGNGEERSKPLSDAKASSVADESAGSTGGDDVPSTDDEKKQRPTCPAQDIIDLYHKHMPDNPECRVLNEARRGAIRQRWKEAAKLNCDPFGYDNREDGLKAWATFFEVCAASDFLTGKKPGLQGKPPFVADIDFLMSPSGFAKCLENKYHREG